jgi:hypothetical protein
LSATRSPESNPGDLGGDTERALHRRTPHAARTAVRTGSGHRGGRARVREHNEAFYASKDERFPIGSTSTLSTELRFARADDPSLRFQVLLPRERDHEYEAEPFGERWIIRTNRGAPNFRLVEAGFDTVRDAGTWRELIGTATRASRA